MNNSSTIFVITAITKIHPRYPADINDWLQTDPEYRSPACLGHHRSMGWFPTLQEAETALQQQTPHLYKAFEWFVIEETVPAFYAQVLSRTCYHYDTTAHKYIKAMEPECLNDYPNLGLF